MKEGREGGAWLCGLCEGVWKERVERQQIKNVKERVLRNKVVAFLGRHALESQLWKSVTQAVSVTAVDKLSSRY